MQADRFNTGKPEWSLVDFPSLEPMVRVLEFGAQKYSRNNWKKGLPINSIIDSLMRHVIAYKEGEDIDPESGISHIGHMMCNLMFLSYVDRNLKDKFDDRDGTNWDLQVEKALPLGTNEVYTDHEQAKHVTKITPYSTGTHTHDNPTIQQETSESKQEVPGLEEGIPIR